MENTVLYYYSHTGNTKFAAEVLAEDMSLTAEALLVDDEPPKKGLKRFLLGGAAARKNADPGLYPIFHMPENFDRVILAFPVWAGRYPPAIGAFLRRYPFEGKKVYVIACSSSGSAESAVDAVAAAVEGNEFCGALSLTDPLRNRAETIVRIAKFAKLLEDDEHE